MWLNSAWPYRDSKILGIMGNTLRAQNEPTRSWLPSAPVLEGVKEVTATRAAWDADNYFSLRGSPKVPLCFGISRGAGVALLTNILSSIESPKECFLELLVPHMEACKKKTRYVQIPNSDSPGPHGSISQVFGVNNVFLSYALYRPGVGIKEDAGACLMHSHTIGPASTNTKFTLLSFHRWLSIHVFWTYISPNFWDYGFPSYLYIVGLQKWIRMGCMGMMRACVCKCVCVHDARVCVCVWVSMCVLGW